MSFRILISLFFIFGCGVKGPPSPPPGTALPSYVDYHMEKNKKKLPDSETEEKEKKKKK